MAAHFALLVVFKPEMSTVGASVRIASVSTLKAMRWISLVACRPTTGTLTANEDEVA